MSARTPDLHEAELRAALAQAWPPESLLIVGDLHAHPEVLEATLARARPRPGERVVLLGDLIDKGPANLRLLRAVAELRAAHPTTVLLGNHDLRWILALRHLEVARDDPRAHLPTRLGLKGLALAREVYLAAGSPEPERDEASARALLEPGAGWEAAFRALAPRWLGPAALERELARLAQKRAELAQALREGFGWRHLELALRLARREFLAPEGTYAWLGRSPLVWRSGALLFVHAGLDDEGVELLAREGPERFAQAGERLAEADPLELYYGPYGRALRTKYRAHDGALSAAAQAELRDRGIQALVTGHRPTPAAPCRVDHGGWPHLEVHRGPGLLAALRLTPAGELERFGAEESP